MLKPLGLRSLLHLRCLLQPAVSHCRPFPRVQRWLLQTLARGPRRHQRFLRLVLWLHQRGREPPQQQALELHLLRSAKSR